MHRCGMLCVMEGDGVGDATSEFIATGRTGRRNAMPDILSDHAATTTADLPEALDKLSCSGRPTTCFSVPLQAFPSFRYRKIPKFLNQIRLAVMTAYSWLSSVGGA
ncbi:hypothetical protein E2C01_056597 [Portunus trituberculatus]|uniref:Uncharacterized protein n=1 Tax=Portunus trituberculatus TaxID=210409 RepID=A0A5B7GUK6_PORTR|nr:hypothetical protein [Portunus trituberculatus]